MKHPLDLKIIEKYDFPPHFLGTDLGLEIEVEGSGLLNSWRSNPTWNYHEEGSLRNGAEFVLAKPIKLSELSEAMDQLAVLTKSAKIKNSIRTSTHIHVNVLDYTVREVYTALVMYWLVENALVQTQGVNRIGNLHCLRLCDSEGAIGMIGRELADGVPFRDIANDNYRYLAVNLAALGKFGTLEFRFFAGMTDPEVTKAWCQAMVQLVRRARTYSSPFEVLRSFGRVSPQHFLDGFLPAALRNKVPTDPVLFAENAGVLYEVARLVQQLSRNKSTLSWASPEHNEDLLKE